MRAEAMADSLYLNLWFSSFEVEDMLAHSVSVMRQFPFSHQLPGITSLAIHPIDWTEPTVLEQRFRPGVSPEEAAGMAADLLHEDYAYVFEAHWDLWTPRAGPSNWIVEPSTVKFIVRGEGFEQGEGEREGQVQIDFGLDSPFLHEELVLSEELRGRVRSNVETLVGFSDRLKRLAGSPARLLWSESEENLAKKLMGRFEKLH
jgi:hypothetical protein